MAMAKVIPFKPQQPAVSQACRWLEAWQRVTEANVRACFVLQRVALRAFWRV